MPRISISRGITAGLIAGVVFMVLEMLLVATAGGGSPWGPPRMIAAIGMGKGVLPPPASFDFGIVAIGMIIHFGLAAVLGIVFALLSRSVNLSTPAILVVGALFGLAVYFVNFYLLTGVFPWFAMARTWITVLSHLVFGLVLAWVLMPVAKPATS